MQRIIIDVREPFEYATGHVDGALNIPPAEIIAGTKKLKKVHKDAEIIVYCNTGSRASATIPFLKQHGYTNVVNGVSAEQVEKKYL